MLHPGPHHGSVAPVDIAQPLIQPPSLGVVQAHAQRDPLVAELAGGGLGRAGSGPCRSPGPTVARAPPGGRAWAHREAAGGPRDSLAGSQSRNTSPTGRPSSQATSSTPRPRCCRARWSVNQWRCPRTATSVKVSVGPWPDLHLRGHEPHPSDPSEPVYLISARASCCPLWATATTTKTTRSFDRLPARPQMRGGGTRLSMPAFRSVVSVLEEPDQAPAMPARGR